MAGIPIALQLYSVREDCARDLPATLKAVAAMGYDGVEFAGYHGRRAAELRRMLDDLGLKACGSHVGILEVLGDRLPSTIEFHQALGNRFLIVPGLPEEYRNSRAAWRKTAQLFNELVEKVQPADMRVGYHNHWIEFEAMEGELPWDTFFSAARPEVVMQFDTGNALRGGAEAVVYLKRYPGRATTVHLKEWNQDNPAAVIGEGEVPWPRVFELCETIGGTEWYIVEQEVWAVSPLDSAKQCLDNLRGMGK